MCFFWVRFGDGVGYGVFEEGDGDFYWDDGVVFDVVLD